MYRSMQEAEQLVIDAINAGLAAMHKAPEEELKESVLGFVKKYGFLVFITALPTTADFITYGSVYLPKNHFIKEESLLQRTILPISTLLTSRIQKERRGIGMVCD